MVESGDRLDKSAKENILFMPNHQSTADVPLCMTLFNARGNFAGRVMWIMDRVFKYSNFGCVSWMHDDFFILAVSTILIFWNLFTKYSIPSKNFSATSVSNGSLLGWKIALFDRDARRSGPTIHFHGFVVTLVQNLP